VASVHVRVRVAGEQYALPVEQVTEVVELEALTEVPGAPDSLLGLRNLRGEILPVIDLASVLGLHRDAQPARLVVATDGGRHAGFAIDEVLDVAALPETSPEHTLGYVRQTAVADGALLGVLDAGALLDALTGTRS
jgi:purine-binding chemotaxis protein CheW